MELIRCCRVCVNQRLMIVLHCVFYSAADGSIQTQLWQQPRRNKQHRVQVNVLPFRYVI